MSVGNNKVIGGWFQIFKDNNFNDEEWDWIIKEWLFCDYRSLSPKIGVGDYKQIQSNRIRENEGQRKGDWSYEKRILQVHRNGFRRELDNQLNNRNNLELQ